MSSIVRRVLHCIDTLDPKRGGPPGYARAAAQVLAGRGITARIATTDGVPMFHADTMVTGVTWARLRTELQISDVVHIHGFFAVYVVRVAALCLLARKPFVISPHGQLDIWCLNHRRIKKKLFLAVVGRLILHYAGALIGATIFEARQIKRLSLTAKVFVAEPAIEVPPVSRVPSLAAGLKLLFLGRLDPIKRVELLISTVALLINEGFAVSLDIVGDGSLEYVEGLRRLVATTGAARYVVFHGFLQGESKEQVLRSCDVLVLPSAHENFSLVAAEAMAAGLPVVLSADVGIAEDVDRAGAGVRLQETTPQAIASAIRWVADASVRERMGNAGRALVAERYSTERFSLALQQAYQHARNIKPFS